jgi:hypothetical protein
MVDALDAVVSTRRRRSDARRSVEAILNAACAVLGERPNASMEEIATSAGVTRQTVYAHFPTRDALVGAIIEKAGAEALGALDAARLDTRAPAEALTGFLDIGWQFLRRYLPLLLNSTVHSHLAGWRTPSSGSAIPPPNTKQVDNSALPKPRPCSTRAHYDSVAPPPATKKTEPVPRPTGKFVHLEPMALFARPSPPGKP